MSTVKSRIERMKGKKRVKNNKYYESVYGDLYIKDYHILKVMERVTLILSYKVVLYMHII